MHLLTTLALASDWDEAHRLGDMAVWTSATAEARAAPCAEVDPAPHRAGPPRADVLHCAVYEAPS
ncbi:MAG: hypothetical protein KC656_28865, partial [Myxococcales bacterium]|nr:hypothetical protein [Myxococcales bacterium]